MSADSTTPHWLGTASSYAESLAAEGGSDVQGKVGVILNSLPFALYFAFLGVFYVVGRLYLYINYSYRRQAYSDWVACYFDAFYNVYTATVPDMVAVDGANGVAGTYGEYYHDVALRNDAAVAACGASVGKYRSVAEAFLLIGYTIAIATQAFVVVFVLIRVRDVALLFTWGWWRFVGKVLHRVFQLLAGGVVGTLSLVRSYIFPTVFSTNRPSF